MLWSKKKKVEQEWDTDNAADLSKSYHCGHNEKVRLKQSLDQVSVLSGLLGSFRGRGNSYSEDLLVWTI